MAAVALALLAAGAAGAAEWGLIQPGVSSTQDVRGRYGAPTRVEPQKVEGYDTESWVYEGAHAPVGMNRLVVEFGLLQDGKYRREVVRDFRLEPKPGTFNRGIVTNGWGLPDRVGVEANGDVFLYRDGLLVYFDPSGWNARLMIFTVPQPRDPAEEPTRR